MSELTTQTVTGEQLKPWLNDVAKLRIAVFRDFPYLYKGSLDYERQYLHTYIDSDSAVCVLAFADDQVVGAATGLAMSDEETAFRQPIVDAGIEVNDVFYCAESVLLPAYRGRGIYRQFFAERETQAKGLGLNQVVFCAVDRPHDHPLKPADYQSLDGIWRRYGYQPLSGVAARFSWQDVDADQETEKTLSFYHKTL
ncbi:GNAT family N-acetyltransferase [Saccharospirillum sp. MSK14-1]|uniref:GNAT family N-acetyltransferase n=1 Tax=Saccharospirillum sp. MSK14-1 TaxID=1897632 RepID=UPI000D36AC39|nr:GNAT family N-acetyltransferase [Saccharospirillum sp. MSK14-1]PTY37434.1 GNAT family N-acetyltransferase [Saccharospirillum sp. MSK14-1]